MAYAFATRVSLPFTMAVQRVTEELSKEGFGVLTEIDVKATLKKKLDVDFRDYRILGACNPPFAHRALLAEPRIGLVLPCNIVVQDTGGGTCEIAAIDPLASMQAVDNALVRDIAAEVRTKLARVIERVGS